MAGLGTFDKHGIDMNRKEADFDYFIVDQDWEKFSDEEHETWGILFERMAKMLPGYACKEYLDGLDKLDFNKHQIPNFKEISTKLRAMTGWEVVAVPGLIPEKAFFEMLASRKFPAGDFIRTRDQLDYIEEPDVFHDGFGHLPILTNPVFADYMQAYGEAGLKAMEHKAVKYLTRLYWYTVEFGLIETEEGLRIFGGGIVSSSSETEFSLHSDSPNRIGLDIERVMLTDYRYDDFQQTYFVIKSFEDLFKQTIETDFAPLYERIKQAEQYKPTQILPSDKVYHKGTNEYALSKEKEKA